MVRPTNSILILQHSSHTTGGANGIGASFVKLCVQQGAYICFGDLDQRAGNELAQSLVKPGSEKPRALFVHTNVAQYDSILNLFRMAYRAYGRVDAAVSCAALQEDGNWFDPELDTESVQQKPSLRTLDVNLTGTSYFARVAAVFLRQRRQADEDKSLTLIASVAAFKDGPGLFLYQASGGVPLLVRLSLLTATTGLQARCPGTHAVLTRVPARGVRRPGECHLPLVHAHNHDFGYRSRLDGREASRERTRGRCESNSGDHGF